jgi:hypothetical protein
MPTKLICTFISVIILIFSGCSSPTPDVATIVLKSTETAIPSFPPTATPTLIPALISSLTPTAQRDSSLKLSTQCVDIQTDINSIQKGSNGTLVIAQDYSTSTLFDKLRVPYLYEFSTGKKIELPGAYNFAVSLDQTRLAYLSHNNALNILNEELEPIKKLEIGDYKIDKWGENGLFVARGNDYAFLELTTGEIRPLSRDFPNIYPMEDWKSWYPIAIYDPTLTRVIYPKLEKLTSSIALWDVQKQKELTRVSEGHALSILPEMTPTWTADGQDVVLAALVENEASGSIERKLIKIDRNGTIQLLMNIPQVIGTLRFAISPNEESIAFWSPDPSSDMLENLSLYVLDIKQNKLTNYCLVSKFLTVPPIWSEDSKQLVVELYQDNENSDVILLNLEENVAAKIAEDAQPIGWLK